MRVAEAVSGPLHSRGYTTLLLVTAIVGLLCQPPLSHFASSLLLRQLPFPQASQLVQLQETERHGNPVGVRPLTRQLWEEGNKTVGTIASFEAWDYTVEQQRVAAARVTPGFFDVLQVRLAQGRFFTPNDYRPKAAPVVIVSDRFWRQQMQSDPRVLGRSLHLRGAEHRIVGVLPSSFWFGNRSADLWLPLSESISARDRAARFVSTIARLRPGVTFGQAQGEMQSLTREMAAKDVRQPKYLRVLVTPLADVLWPEVSAGLVLMLLGSLALLAFVIKTISEQVQAGVAARPAARYWGLLSGKLLLLQVGLLLLWLELQEAVVSQVNAHWTIIVLVQCTVAILFLALCAALAKWCQTDQRYRCRTCLSRLRMPLESGSLGSVLFDRPGAEYICPSGCGQLYVPRPRPSDEGVERWTPSKGLWTELELLGFREK